MAITITATHRKTRQTQTVRVTESGLTAAMDRLARKCGGHTWFFDGALGPEMTQRLAQPATWIPSHNAYSLGSYWLLDWAVDGEYVTMGEARAAAEARGLRDTAEVA